MNIIDRLRRRFAESRRGPKCRCPRDGELFFAPGFFHLTHESTLDGVACGELGVELAFEEEQLRLRAPRHDGGHADGAGQRVAGGPAASSDGS